MALVLTLLLQAAAAAQGPAPATDGAPPRNLGFRIVPDRRCASRDADEIVVCGTRGDGDRYRLAPLVADYEPRQLRAETGLIDGVVANIHAESAGLPNGMISKRVMVTFKIPF